nr:hypothetical protein [uncultured Schaedlerella sp.]
MSTRTMYLNDLDRLTTEMMEYICDKLCRYPEMERDEESLAELCAGCRMGEFLCNILSHEGARTNETEKRP